MADKINSQDDLSPEEIQAFIRIMKDPAHFLDMCEKFYRYKKLGLLDEYSEAKTEEHLQLDSEL